jgi:hypothetical protein
LAAHSATANSRKENYRKDPMKNGCGKWTNQTFGSDARKDPKFWQPIQLLPTLRTDWTFGSDATTRTIDVVAREALLGSSVQNAVLTN